MRSFFVLSTFSALFYLVYSLAPSSLPLYLVALSFLSMFYSYLFKQSDFQFITVAAYFLLYGASIGSSSLSAFRYVFLIVFIILAASIIFNIKKVNVPKFNLKTYMVASVFWLFLTLSLLMINFLLNHQTELLEYVVIGIIVVSAVFVFLLTVISVNNTLNSSGEANQQICFYKFSILFFNVAFLFLVVYGFSNAGLGSRMSILGSVRVLSNYSAILILLNIFIVAQLRGDYFFKVFLLVMLMLALYMLMTTASRGVIIAIFVFLLGYAIVKLSYKRLMSSLLFVLSVLVSFLFLSNLDAYDYAYNRLMRSVENPEIDIRAVIWDLYLTKYFADVKSVFFGVGVEWRLEGVLSGLNAHSVFLDVLVRFGLLGVCILMVPVVYTAQIISRSGNRTFMLAFLLFLLLFIPHGATSNYYFWFSLAVLSGVASASDRARSR